MSTGCNFINWMAATRVAKGQTTSADNLNHISETESSLTRTSSGNQLPGSVETICGDRSQTTATSAAVPSNRLQPLEIGIEPPTYAHATEGDDISSVFTNTESDIVSSEDLLQIEMENLELDREIQDLEREALYWEQKVEDLERQQFAEDVPRTLVENIIKHRKELRELELQLYEMSLTNPSLGLINSYNDALSFKSANKLASHLRPGQENTADILDAVPPSGSLQHRQYLSKASSGTDSGEYSQLPSYRLHRPHRVDDPESPISHHQPSADNFYDNKDRHHEHLPQQLQPPPNQQRHRQFYRPCNTAGNTQLRIYSRAENERESCRDVPRLQRVSPVRPNHFKGEFVAPRVQDSSSTASSGSTQ